MVFVQYVMCCGLYCDQLLRAELWDRLRAKLLQGGLQARVCQN